MRAANPVICIQKDSILNNTFITGSNKIPIFADISVAPESCKGQVGNLIFTQNDSTFWGNTGTMWIRLGSSSGGFGQIVTILDSSNGPLAYSLPINPVNGYTETVQMYTKRGMPITISAPKTGFVGLNSTNSIKTFYKADVNTYKMLDNIDSFYPGSNIVALIPTGGGTDQFNGDVCAISADGNTIARYGPQSNTLLDNMVWVWTRTNGVWTMDQQFGPTGASGQVTALYDTTIGTTLAMSASGDTIAIGSMTDTEGPGAVWIFTKIGGEYIQQDKLIATGMTGIQGAALAFSADASVLAMGSYDNATIFTKSGGAWHQTALLLPTTAGTIGYTVGLSANGRVAICGGTIATATNVIFTQPIVGGAWAETARISIILLSNIINTSLSADGMTFGTIGKINVSTSQFIYANKNGWGIPAQVYDDDPFSTTQFEQVVKLTADGNTAILASKNGQNPMVYQRQNNLWVLANVLAVVTGITSQTNAACAALSADGTIFALGGQTAGGEVYVYTI